MSPLFLHRNVLCEFKLFKTHRGRDIFELMNVNERRCPFCDNVEDEGHGFLTPIYINIRLELIWKATIIRPTFDKK